MSDVSPEDPDRPAAAMVWRDAVVLAVGGGQAQEFLQGYLSSNTDRLRPDEALPMALCNLKGRVVAAGWAIVWSPDDATDGGATTGVGLIIHATLANAVRTFLRPYVTFSKCRLAPVDYALTIDPSGIELVPGLSVRPTVAAVDGEAAVTGDDASERALTALTRARFVFVSAPVSERFLPQMLALQDIGAVDFDKGCYLGQEIVARAQFRGAVKRKLTAVSIEQGEVGAELADKSVIVQITSRGDALTVTPV